MGYRIVKRKIEREIMYVITDSDGEEISEWEDLEEARAELHDLNDGPQDVVDFMNTCTPGLGTKDGDDEDLEDCQP